MMLFWYFKDSDPSLIGYSDTNCVANADDRKSTISRRDIYFSVGVYIEYLANPMESHLSAIKHIIWFVNTTINDVILVF